MFSEMNKEKAIEKLMQEEATHYFSLAYKRRMLFLREEKEVILISKIKLEN